MNTLPKIISKLLEDFSPVFSRPTLQRFCLLLLAAIVTTGSRTVSNLLRTVDFVVSGHSSSYHRVFSKRRWSTWKLSKILIRLILERYYPDNKTVKIVGDDTVDEHPGRKVFGKGRHRDAVRSSHTFTAFRWGHKWVVVSILVKFPFAQRPWALPVLIALYYAPATSKELGHKHRTPVQIMEKLLRVLMRWFPERKFKLSVDSGLASHDLATFVAGQPRNLTLISKFYPNANLYSAPKSYNGRGRPSVKGRKILSPEGVVAQTSVKNRKRLSVSWYGGEKRRVEVVEDTGYWYKSGNGVVEVRWVFVHDLTGTHRDEYFFTTDIRMTSKKIIDAYTGRWSTEVTFEEVRAYVGFGSTCGRTKQTVLRSAPCLLGLYSVIAILFDQLPKAWKKPSITWSGKSEITFSDAITDLRRFLWKEWIFETLHFKQAFQKLPSKIQNTLIYNLAPAA